MLKNVNKEVADMIFERGAFKFGAFKLKLHEKNPNAPLSPFYVNLRTKDNPGTKGLLAPADCELIARALWHKALKECLSFQAIAGLPHAADPFITAIDKMTSDPKGFRVVSLAKEITKKGRRIVPASGFGYREEEKVLLFDDLITGGDSKIEAIESVESQGSIVAGLVVLLDREQGGIKQIEASGCDVFCCFKITELLDYYYKTGKINRQKYEECIAYVKNN